jgi:hypothetical protein
MFPAGSNTPFKGYVTNELFDFKPTIIYQNSFLPQIRGEIDVCNEWTRIHIKMTINIFGLIFTYIYLGGTGIACLAFLPQLLGKNHAETIIIPFLMFLFGYVLATGAFKSESIKAKSLLIDLLEPEWSNS